MKYVTGANFRRALETRLRTLSQRDGAPLARLRKFVAFDRLLARLLRAGPEAWVLKGGLALQIRLGQRARTTKDMDLMWLQSTDDLHQLLVEAASLDVHDWFRFVIVGLTQHTLAQVACPFTHTGSTNLRKALYAVLRKSCYRRSAGCTGATTWRGQTFLWPRVA